MPPSQQPGTAANYKHSETLTQQTGQAARLLVKGQAQLGVDGLERGAPLRQNRHREDRPRRRRAREAAQRLRVDLLRHAVVHLRAWQPE
jgi:hypothetical protein